MIELEEGHRVRLQAHREAMREKSNEDRERKRSHD